MTTFQIATTFVFFAWFFPFIGGAVALAFTWVPPRLIVSSAFSLVAAGSWFAFFAIGDGEPDWLMRILSTAVVVIETGFAVIATLPLFWRTEAPRLIKDHPAWELTSIAAVTAAGIGAGVLVV